MRRVLVAVGLLLSVTAACGDGTKTITAGDEPGSQTDVCVTEKIPEEWTRTHNQDIHDGQRLLQDDIEKIRTYGDAHPEDFSGVEFAIYPESGTRGVFVANLEKHEAAIRPTLEHPNKFDVREGVFSAKESERVRHEIEDNPAFPHHAFGYGTSDGHLTISLYATKEGRAAARTIHERWGRAVCIDMAGHPYPHGAWPDETNACIDEPLASTRNADVDFELIPEKTTLARGERGNGVVRITNRGSTPLEATTGSSVFAGLSERGTSISIGTVIGPHTAIALIVHVDPGETREFPLEFGTDDCRPDADYAIPAGTYVAQASLPGFGRADDVEITVVE